MGLRASVTRGGIYDEPAVLHPFENRKPPSVNSKCAAGPVPMLDDDAVVQLATQGITLRPLEPMGAEVSGMDLRTVARDSPLLPLLQAEMAKRGYLVFRAQGVLSGAEQVKASELWGGRRMHSTHGVHHKAPNEHIFRLSNVSSPPDSACATPTSLPSPLLYLSVTPTGPRARHSRRRPSMA